MAKIDLVITKKKGEYFLTKIYDDGSPEESIPMDFHRKCQDENKNANPWQLWREKVQQEKKDKNEEALEKPVKTVSRFIKTIEKHQKKMNERALERPMKTVEKK
jgi:hypothetical protein